VGRDVVGLRGQSAGQFLAHGGALWRNLEQVDQQTRQAARLGCTERGRRARRGETAGDVAAAQRVARDGHVQLARAAQSSLLPPCPSARQHGTEEKDRAGGDQRVRARGCCGAGDAAQGPRVYWRAGVGAA
jgi:hypothetical protein